VSREASYVYCACCSDDCVGYRGEPGLCELCEEAGCDCDGDACQRTDIDGDGDIDDHNFGNAAW
jgi:hypothetical protein